MSFDNIESHNQFKNLEIDNLKSLLNNKIFDKLILGWNFKEININNYWSISFDENRQAILSKDLYFKLYWSKPKKWSDTNLDYTNWDILYLNKNYLKFKKTILLLEGKKIDKKKEIKRSKEYDTAILLDKIYSELTWLSYFVDKNKQKTIDEKINNLENKSIEYSNIFQLKIKVLRDILNDFKWITWRELDKTWSIDFKHNFNLFSQELKNPYEKIKTNDISIVLSNKFSKNNQENKDINLNDLYKKFKYDLTTKLDFILKNNSNTKVVFFDYQFDDDILEELWEVIKKYKREDIKVIFSAWKDIDTNRKIVNIWWLYASTMVGLDSNNSNKASKEIYNTFIDNNIKTKGIVTKYLTRSKQLMTVSNTINIVTNPRNLLKPIPRKLDKLNNIYYNDYKWSKNSLNTYRDIENIHIPDTKIILLWSEQSWKKDSELDIFTNIKTWLNISWTEVLANTILDNNLNSI